MVLRCTRLELVARLCRYLGQAAWMTKNIDQIDNTFFASIPFGDGFYWVSGFLNLDCTPCTCTCPNRCHCPCAEVTRGFKYQDLEVTKAGWKQQEPYFAAFASFPVLVRTR